MSREPPGGHARPAHASHGVVRCDAMESTRYLMHPSRSEAMAFDEDGRATLLMLDGDAPRALASSVLEGIGRPSALATDGARVFHAGEDATLLELAWGRGTILARASLPAELAPAGAMSADGRWVLRMEGPGWTPSPRKPGIHLLDRVSGRLRVLRLPSDFPSPVALDPGSTRFAALHTEQGGALVGCPLGG
jgi:hypothetical protein